MRLDKALGDLAIGTRSELKKAARSGRIQVNGVVIKDPGFHIDPETDEIRFDGIPVVYHSNLYFMLNKPAGYITATRGSEPNVLDFFDETIKNLYPVGRLDKDTEGLLLITNDGPLGHELLSPKHHVDKEYEVHLKEPIRASDIEILASGMQIDGGETCLPAECKVIEDRLVHLIIREGKFHQIKRMFLALGNEVVYLKRLRMKNLVLDETLLPGEYRDCTEEEIADLKSSDRD